jgi:hypothetical protein
LALLTKIWEKVVSNLMMIYKDIERYEETWKHMKTRNIYQYIYIIHYNSIYIYIIYICACACFECQLVNPPVICSLQYLLISICH